MEKAIKWRAGVGGNSVVEKIGEDIGGDQEELLAIEEFKEYMQNKRK